MRNFAVFLIVSLFVAKLSNAQTVNRNDVVIDEIMVDPTPQAGLPDAEWIELKNASSFDINLSGWRIGNLAAQSGILPNFVLQPDSFVIVCTGSNLSDMSAFGQAISVTSFPSLNNDAGVIYLRSNDNKVVSAFNYSNAWYKNELKKRGGWSLEMIDTKNACSGYTNWNASSDIRGGTPGKINSIDAVNADETPPRLIRSFATNSTTISLIFDEPLDSQSASMAANFSVSDGIGVPVSATAISPLFDKVDITISAALSGNKVYNITANTLTDCAGNIITLNNTAKTGLASLADSFDIVINEILFNPEANGVDYVEIYNRSANIINLKQLYIANRNSAGVISSIEPLSIENILIFAGDFVVLTEEPSLVQQKFITANPGAFVQVSGMPSFPDDNGDVIILNAQGEIIDEVRYLDKWHYELITNTEGVSLERIDYNAPSLQANFHSAATSAGYGTPGYKNSQFRIDAQIPGSITLSPEIFSPDNDGMDDFATISYDFPTPGYIANITVFDAAGRSIRYLQRNALCGVKGNFIWDGLGDKHQKLPQGIYIVFTDIFSASGKKKQFKNVIVLAAVSK